MGASVGGSVGGSVVGGSVGGGVVGGSVGAGVGVVVVSGGGSVVGGSVGVSVVGISVVVGVSVVVVALAPVHRNQHQLFKKLKCLEMKTMVISIKIFQRPICEEKEDREGRTRKNCKKRY